MVRNSKKWCASLARFVEWVVYVFGWKEEEEVETSISSFEIVCGNEACEKTFAGWKKHRMNYDLITIVWKEYKDVSLSPLKWLTLNNNSWMNIFYPLSSIQNQMSLLVSSSKLCSLFM